MRGNVCTFIVPTLNRPTLARTVDSLYDQDDGRWEAIVGGDGVFPEYAWERKQHFEPGMPRGGAGRVQIGECKRIGSAGIMRNRLMDLYGCQSGPPSEYFAFVDDDDWIEPDYVSTLARHAYSAPPDVVIFRMRHPVLGTLPNMSHPDPLFHGNVGISYALRTETAREFQFVCEDLNNEGPQGNEDIELLLRLRRAGAWIVFTPKVLYHVGNPRTVRG